MLSHQPTPDNQSLVANATTNPTPRGEVNHDLETIANMDTRLGVPVPIGARVWAGELEGVLIGATDELAVIRDDRGQQFAERWGLVTINVRGPHEISSSYIDEYLAKNPELREAYTLSKAAQIFLLREQLRDIEGEIDSASLKLKSATFDLIHSDVDMIVGAANQFAQAVESGQDIIYLLTALGEKVSDQANRSGTSSSNSAADPVTGDAPSIDKDSSEERTLPPADEHNRHDIDLGSLPNRPGVLAAVGDYVYFTDCDAEGQVVATTEDEVVIINQHGQAQVNWWKCAAVQASGPRHESATDKNAADGVWTGVFARPPHASLLKSLTNEELALIDSDPYRSAALLALKLMAHVDRIEDKYTEADSDKRNAVDLLSEVEMLLGTLSDNRVRRILDKEESEVVE